jgi:hypothetical protein
MWRGKETWCNIVCRTARSTSSPPHLCHHSVAFCRLCVLVCFKIARSCPPHVKESLVRRITIPPKCYPSPRLPCACYGLSRYRSRSTIHNWIAVVTVFAQWLFTSPDQRRAKIACGSTMTTGINSLSQRHPANAQ